MTIFSYQKKIILVCYLINLYKNLGSYSRKTKINSFILFIFGFYKSKRLAGRNLNIYKPIMEENLLAKHSKTFPKRGITIGLCCAVYAQRK